MSDSTPRLKADRPAELLAYLSHAYGQPIRDCTAIVAVSAQARLLGAARIPNDAIRDGRDTFRAVTGDVLATLASKGAVSVVLAAISRTPYTQAGEPDLVEAMHLEIATALAATIAADHGLSCRSWILADGHGRRVDVTDGEIDTVTVERIEGGTTLLECEQAASGEPLPRLDHDPVTLTTAQRDRLADALHTADAPADPGRTVEAAWETLARAGRLGEALDKADVLTAVAQLAGAVAGPVGRDRLLDLIVTSATGRTIAKDTGIVEAVQNPAMRPDRAAAPGGATFDRIDDLTSLLDDADAGTVYARAGLHCLLAFLCWWDCRFAAMGDHLRTAEAIDPGYSLARLLTVLRTVETSPAWAGAL